MSYQENEDPHLSSFYSFSQQKQNNKIKSKVKKPRQNLTDLNSQLTGQEYDQSPSKTLEKTNSFGNLHGKTKSRKQQYELISNSGISTNSFHSRLTQGGLPPRNNQPTYNNLGQKQD